MEKPLGEWTLAELLARIAAADSLPSGGAGAAVSAALGVGLVQLGLEVAAKRKRMGRPLPAEATRGDLDALIALARGTQKHLLDAGEADMAAVNHYLSASVAEKPGALVEATKSPLAAAHLMHNALRLAADVCRLVPLPVLADVVAGAWLLAGAIQAMLGAVDSNLRGLSRHPGAEQIGQERDDLAAQADAVMASVQEIVKARRPKRFD